MSRVIKKKKKKKKVQGVPVLAVLVVHPLVPIPVWPRLYTTPGLGFGVWVSGFGFEVWGSGLGVWSLGFRV